ncbi:MAG: polysaccharide deacetylase family protein [Clostridia bacterium]|nr:polysaccharide deacetylase family protein [Clostridia bacterium]
MSEIKKALTFSYDDGVTQDKRLVDIFNRYGLKATFNLNSALLGKTGELLRNGVRVNHTKINSREVKCVYEGHEVAVHTLTHPNLNNLTEEEIIKEVNDDREALSDIVGYEVKGMAYPCCAPDERVIDIVKNKTIVKYARSTNVTYSSNPSADMLNYCGTVYHHRDWDRLFEMGKEFLELKPETPQIMYIWGHSYEFDIFPERWEKFEEFCKIMSNQKDIFYGTNIQVFEKFGLV